LPKAQHDRKAGHGFAITCSRNLPDHQKDRNRKFDGEAWHAAAEEVH
jgi:hypothetical protein